MELTKEFIEENWPLTEVEIGEVLQKSGDRTVGLIESKQGKHIYKTPGEWKAPEALARDLTAFDFLNNYGFRHISSVLKTRTKEDFINKDGQLIYLLNYVEREHPELSIKTYTEFGKIMASLHEVKDFPFETDFEAGIVIEDLKKNSANYTFGKEYLEVVENLPSFKNLPKTLIHTEITPKNSIQKKSGEIILLDWDEVGVGVSVLDVGESLINHFISEDLIFHKDIARAFYTSYFQERKLTDEEMKHIFDVGIFWACMYIIYDDMDKRWRRIKWAIENRETFDRLLKECAN